MKTILFLICIPLLVFASLERENLSLLVADKFQDMDYYIGTDIWISNYNEAVLLIRGSQYPEAKSLLQPILNQRDLVNPADVYELYGDLVYEADGSTGDVAVFYQRSLEYLDTPRIRKKLELLSTITEPKQEENTDNTGSLNVPEDMTGALERESRRQELSLSWETRQNIRDLSAGMAAPQDLISRTLDILATGSSVPKDW